MQHMRQRILQLFVVTLLMVCVGAHFAELFDTWDQTLQTGNDIESALVVVALCLGICVVLVNILSRPFRMFIWRMHPFLVFQFLRFHTLEAIRTALSSSRPPLRV
jgi:hypothetical protein